MLCAASALLLRCCSGAASCLPTALFPIHAPGLAACCLPLPAPLCRHNGGTWMLLYSLHARMPWRWSAATLVLTSLASVRPAACPGLVFACVGRPCPVHAAVVAAPASVLPPTPAYHAFFCPSTHPQPSLCFHLPAVQLRMGDSVCRRLLGVDGGKEQLTTLTYVLHLAQ